MKAIVLIVAVVAHFVVPLFLIAWTGFSRAKSRAYWLCVAAITALVLLLMHVAGAGWSLFGFYWPFVLWALFVLGIGRFSSRTLGELPWWPTTVGGWIGVAVVFSVAIFMGTSLPALYEARVVPDEVVELRWPMRGGTYFVGHGGSHEVMNHHFPHSGQRYALDVVKLNSFGSRARGLMPEDLEAYEIWGEPVYAPCAGQVATAVGDQPDFTPPERDPEFPPGNHVTLFCDGATVLLAHLREGSLEVEAGQEVSLGQKLGEIGNSGNTTEPHLHIHAVRGEVTDLEELLSTGEGIGMLFEGRYLLRNQRVSIR